MVNAQVRQLDGLDKICKKINNKKKFHGSARLLSKKKRPKPRGNSKAEELDMTLKQKEP